MAKTLFLSTVILLLLGMSGIAQVPRQITYQGYLTDNANNPISGNVNLTFALYDALIGGNTLWEEVQNPVAVINGVFRVVMGSNTPLDLPFDEPYWLGIKVGNDPELTPRIALTGVGYSFYSLKSDSVANLADESVTTDKIANGAVTQAKLAVGTSLPPGGTAGGDLSGSYPDPTVAKIQGYQISNTVPNNNQVLKWNGNMWTPVDNIGIVPVGTVLPWLKTFTGTPALPAEFAECNGQQITDQTSPFYLQYLPDLNGGHRFLRGGTTSGAIGGSETHYHAVDIGVTGTSGPSSTAQTGYSLGFYAAMWDHGHSVDPNPTNSETINHLPLFYEVVWIIRIK